MSERQNYKVLKMLSFLVCISIWYFSFGVFLFEFAGFKIPFVRAAAITWDAGGGDDDWCTDANWSGDAEPTSSDDVTIDVSGLTVTTDGCVTEGNDLDFSSLTIGGSNSTTLWLEQNIGTGGDITVANLGTLTQANAVSQTITGSFIVSNGGTLNHANNSNAQDYVFDFSAASFDLQEGGTVDVDALGYDGGDPSNPPSNGYGPGGGGLSNGSGAGGGAYAGEGAPGHSVTGGASTLQGTGGDAYGSLESPTFLGSGGGGAISSRGGSGGGAFKMTITGGGTATVTGNITARGGAGVKNFNRPSGGGAGGSIWINYAAGGIFAGGGTLSVRGGAGAFVVGTNSYYAGSGGGGRIAITGYSSDISTSTYILAGGNATNSNSYDGAGGTLWNQVSGSNGDLTIGRVPDINDSYAFTPVSTTLSVDALRMRTNSRLLISYATVTIANTTSTIDMGSTTSTAYIDVDSSTLNTSSTFSIPDDIYVTTDPNDWSNWSDVTIESGGTLKLKEITTSTAWTGLDTLLINGTLTHKSNSSTVLHAIYLEATTITIGSGATVTADGLGYTGGSAGSNGNGPGAGLFGANDGGGGGYGGNGGDGESSGATGGSSYGTTSTPAANFGSGGGGQTNTAGGNGGGVIYLVATGVLTINGDVSADGTVGGQSCGGIPASGAGGGSGGGIHLEADTITGSGSISVAGGDGGGNGGSCGGGGGGGGRILLSADTNTFAGTTTSTGGVSGGPSGSAESGDAGTDKQSPSAPTTLYSNSTDASAGDTNPTGLTSTTPVFSAIYNGTVDATGARIQISTSSVFATSIWDSGNATGSITSCSDGARCQDIIYGNIGSSATTSLSLDDDTSEASDTVYYWRIQFIDADDVVSTWSASSTFTLLDAPDEVTNIATSSVSATGITLAWDDNSSIEDNYLVSYADDGVSFSNTSTIAASTTSTALTGLTPNTDYTFNIVGTNAAGNSDNITTSVLLPANVPSALVSTASTETSVTMAWTANSNPSGTEYCIVQGSNTCSVSDWQTATTKTFSSLEGSTTYQFKVKARNSADVETDFTSTVSVTTQSGGGAGSSGGGTPPPAPDPLPDPDPECDPAVDKECEEDPLQPTGLIQIINKADFNVLVESGVGNNYISDGYKTTVFSESTDPILDLDEPFTMEISLTPQTNPMWRANLTNKIVSKGDAYSFGYGKGGSDILTNGFCFYASGTKVCDKKQPVPFEKIEYTVTWDGSTLVLLDKTKTLQLDTSPLSAMKIDPNPLVIGGTKSEYASGKFASSFFPATLHKVSIVQENPVKYINSKDVTLKIDATYSNLLWLEESDGEPSEKFETAILEDIAAEKSWTLSGPDGKKCINAKFLNQPEPGEGGQTYEYVTYACVFLDTTDPPIQFSLETGVVNGKIEMPPRLFGFTEPKAKVTIKVVQTSTGLAYNPFSSAIDQALGGSHVAFLAATNSGTYTTNADSSGNWDYFFSTYFDEGSYDITVSSVDLAGNSSIEDTKTLTISEEEVPDCATTEEGCEEIPEECEGDSCEEPACEGDACEEVPECEGDSCEEVPEECEGDSCEEPACEGDACNDDPVDNDTDVDPNDTDTDTDTNADVNSDTDSSNGLQENGSGSDSSDATESVVETFVENLKEVPIIGNAVELIEQTVEVLKEIIDNPQVEAANEKVVVPTTLAIGVANVAAAGQLPNVFIFLKYLFGQPLLLLRRRKRGAWGTVYNSFTKQPVDLAAVRIIDDVCGKVIRTQVTDAYGRYFLFVPKGRYRIEVVKQGFSLHSSALKGKVEDIHYTHLYHGEAFVVEGEQKAITYSIPIDPKVEDKDTRLVVKEYSKKIFQHVLSLSGLIASIISFIISPSALIAAFVAMHMLFYVAFKVFSRQKLGKEWGTISAIKDGSKLSRVVVRVFEAEYNKLVNTSVSDTKGRYAALVGPGEFFVTYEKAGFKPEKSKNLDFKEGKTDGVGGLIKEDQMLRTQKSRAKDMDIKQKEIHETKGDENYMEEGATVAVDANITDKEAHEKLIQHMKDKAAGVDD